MKKKTTIEKPSTEQKKVEKETPKLLLGDPSGAFHQRLSKRYGSAMFTANRRPNVDMPRLPFRIFSLDYATGGGMPQWGTTGLFGPESSGKSTTAWSAAAAVQSLCFRCFQYPSFCQCGKNRVEMFVAWINYEGDLDYEWAESIGVDLSRLVCFEPVSGELGLEMARNAIKADDCGLVIVDSLAAIVPESELKEGSLWSQQPGQQAKLIGKFVRIMRMDVQDKKRKRLPITVLFTNQIRQQIGIQFGPTETVSGGHALKHVFTLNIRLQQSAIPKETREQYQKGNRLLATRQKFRVMKSKILTLEDVGEFIRAKAPIPELNLKRGQVKDYNTLWKKAREFRIIEGDGPYSILGAKAKNIEEIYELWRQNPDVYYQVQRDIVTARKKLEYA